MRKIFIKFVLVCRKRGLFRINVPLTSSHYLSFMQNGQNSSQLLFRPLTKFGGKLWNFFVIKSFCFDQISYNFVSFMTKIIRSMWISQLPSWEDVWLSSVLTLSFGQQSIGQLVDEPILILCRPNVCQTKVFWPKDAGHRGKTG